MRIIFLDIDGVLKAGSDYADLGIENIDKVSPQRVEHLNNIVAQTNALVVISSTWRKFLDVREVLKRDGYRGQIHIDWRTNSLHHVASGASQVHTERGTEIADWLRRHSSVTNYLILDDDSDFLDWQKPHFIKTDNRVGLTKWHIEPAVDILFNQPVDFNSAITPMGVRSSTTV